MLNPARSDGRSMLPGCRITSMPLVSDCRSLCVDSGQVGKLSEDDVCGYSGQETDHHRMGDEAGEPAQSQDPGEHHEGAGQYHQHEQ